MTPIIECSPNFSEGRRQAVIDAIVDAIRAAGVQVLETQADAEQNRAVVRFAGAPEAVAQAALAGAAVAVAHIDLGGHTGTHPRIGAVDVIPFAPVAGFTLEECAALARRVGEQLAEQHDLPVYLYAAAAGRPDRRDLAVIRDGQYEGLRDAIAGDPARAPDFGPKRLGPAGAVAVGARPLPIRCTLWLDGPAASGVAGAEHPADAQSPAPPPAGIGAATMIAAALDRDSGGLAHVGARATADAAHGAGIVLTLGRHDQTPLARVVELARLEAARHGARIAAAEIQGLVPQSALLDAAAWHLGLVRFAPEQIIENRLDRSIQAVVPEARGGSVSPRDFVASVAADNATPGGGSVAAVAGALGAALAGMVAGLTVGRAKYAAVDDKMARVRNEAQALQGELLDLMVADSAAYQSVMDAYGLPRATAEESAARREAIQRALRRATETPLETMRHAVKALSLVLAAAEHGNANAVSDAGVAGYVALASAQGAALNVETNVIGLSNLDEGDRYRREAAELLREARQLAEGVDRTVRARIAGSQ